jgi:succinate dehydrogenase / fumarate reductase iron-sulfur subunit
MRVTFKVWRQAGPKAPGEFRRYTIDANEHMSFLEAIDVVNEQIIRDPKAHPEGPIAFDHDCREGICGACSMVIDGSPHGPWKATTTCQLHMRAYRDGAEITVEPWRARAFPIVKDLVVDRSAFDRIQQRGGYVSVGTGAAPDANAIPIGKPEADEAFDYAACIGCGACVAACPNASAMLFVGAKIAHLALLPQGQVERRRRVRAMVEQMDLEGFGGCTNHEECEAACPKEIRVDAIAILNREMMKAAASLRGDGE